MSYEGQVFGIIWAIALAVNAVFLPTAAKTVSSGGRIDRDTVGILAVLSFVPAINVPFALFSIVVCIGKLIEYIYESNKTPNCFK